MGLGRINEGGDFFKPADHAGSYVFIFTPKDFEAKVSTKFGPKDTVYSDVEVFSTEAKLLAGEPQNFSHSPIQQAALVKTLKAALDKGDQIAAVLAQVPTDNGNPAWVLRNPSNTVLSQVEKYLAQQEADLAEAVSSGAMPSFLA